MGPTRGGLALESSAGAQRLLSHFRPRLRTGMRGGELRAEVLVALAFLLGATLLARLGPAHPGLPAWRAVLFAGLYAVTSRIEFDVGSGYGTPAQLVLVPMLYALPAPDVPLLVAAGYIAGKLPSVATGRRHPDRLLIALGDSWHSIGPAAIFSLTALAQGPRWSEWPLLLAALAAQLLCDFSATAAREWIRLGRPSRLPLRLLGPVYVTDASLSPIALAVAFGARAHPPLILTTLPLSGLLMFFARDRRARMHTAMELSRAYRGTAMLLGDVVEADDAYTGSHSRDVVELAMAVGPPLGLDEDQVRRLELAALLHDVGKIAIPKEIINKPGPLTAQERTIIETHTIEGESMLVGVGGLLGEVGRIVRSCHERYDGGGYPDRLAGESIPIEARIVAACDALNAMTTDRSYRRGRSMAAALAEMQAHRGTQFDPRVVDALVALHDDETRSDGGTG